MDCATNTFSTVFRDGSEPIGGMLAPLSGVRYAPNASDPTYNEDYDLRRFCGYAVNLIGGYWSNGLLSQVDLRELQMGILIYIRNVVDHVRDQVAAGDDEDGWLDACHDHDMVGVGPQNADGEYPVDVHFSALWRKDTGRNALAIDYGCVDNRATTREDPITMWVSGEAILAPEALEIIDQRIAELKAAHASFKKEASDGR